MLKVKLPDKPGYYLATTQNCEGAYWNVILVVEGDAPYLQARVQPFVYPNGKYFLEDILEIGPELDIYAGIGKAVA